jgi:Na+-transporting methylmalonyl-CoA/oxaloacetate decarboxylase gamma subunit
VVAILLLLVMTMLLAGAGVWSYQERQRRRIEQAADKAEIQAKKDRAARDVQAAIAEQWR